MTEEERAGVSVSRIRRTASRLQYDGYQGHDPAERRGFLQGVLAFQNELLDWKTGGVREEESNNTAAIDSED